MASKAKAKQPLTTAQQLGSLIKSARDTMRKDKGLNGDLDRLPMLTWIMFLKFLDDLELIHEQNAKMAGKPHKPIVQPPYRWRDWAAKEDGITGDDLIRFINQTEAMRPDGKQGPGLFEYLRQLRSADGKDQRDVIAAIFRGVINRMTSGYLLREVINKVNGIHFSSTEEIHTLSHMYESMLKEMRDAAGDSGEFYTPRAVVRFMVEVLDPRLGETVLDPACGTGGFLVEAFTHLGKQAKTVKDRRILQHESILGGEAKPLPFLLAQMNLLLHGVESPQISPSNSLAVPLREIGDRDRVDIIATNPPFGGEEEKGIQGNFPEDKQTSETALLFLQLIMRKLRRLPSPGRAGVVVPNGTLFGDDGVCTRIKEELLKDFNLHTVVRLPDGVFAPYAPIPTNILFFDRSGPTREVWFYEQSLPVGRRAYSKSQPLQYEEFADCLAWWKQRTQTKRAWKVPVEDLLHYEAGRLVSVDLDLQNPTLRENIDSESPPKMFKTILASASSSVSTLQDLQQSLIPAYADLITEAVWMPMGKVAPLCRRPIQVDVSSEYPEVGVRSFGKGTFHKPPLPGAKVGSKKLFEIHARDLLFNIVFAWEGAVAVARKEDDGRYGSHRFLSCVTDPKIVLPEFLGYYFLGESGLQSLRKASPGGAGRNRTLGLQKLAKITVPVPPIEKQKEFVKLLNKIEEVLHIHEQLASSLAELRASILNRAVSGRDSAGA